MCINFVHTQFVMKDTKIYNIIIMLDKIDKKYSSERVYSV